MGHADKNSFRRLLTAMNRIDDAVFKMARDFLPAVCRRAPNDQSMLRSRIKSELLRSWTSPLFKLLTYFQSFKTL